MFFVVTSNRRGIVTGSPGCLKSAPREFLQTSPSVLWLVLLLVVFCWVAEDQRLSKGTRMLSMDSPEPVGSSTVEVFLL